VLAFGNLPNHSKMTEPTAYFPRCQLDTYRLPESCGGHLASIDRIEKAKWKAEIVQLTLHECASLVAAL